MAQVVCMQNRLPDLLKFHNAARNQGVDFEPHPPNKLVCYFLYVTMELPRGKRLNSLVPTFFNQLKEHAIGPLNEGNLHAHGPDLKWLSDDLDAFGFHIVDKFIQIVHFETEMMQTVSKALPVVVCCRTFGDSQRYAANVDVSQSIAGGFYLVDDLGAHHLCINPLVA